MVTGVAPSPLMVPANCSAVTSLGAPVGLAKPAVGAAPVSAKPDRARRNDVFFEREINMSDMMMKTTIGICKVITSE